MRTFFFFNDTATTEIYTLSLHDALPIFQLGLPRPDVNLGTGSGSHARQTAEVLTGMESEFTENSPALAVVYGDVNSTLCAALAAAKLSVPLAHVEGGLRRFDDSIPGEINRRLP